MNERGLQNRRIAVGFVRMLIANEFIQAPPHDPNCNLPYEQTPAFRSLVRLAFEEARRYGAIICGCDHDEQVSTLCPEHARAEFYSRPTRPEVTPQQEIWAEPTPVINIFTGEEKDFDELATILPQEQVG